MDLSKLEENILISLGKEGKSWLDSIPIILEELKSKWHLESIVPFKNLSYNYVARAYCIKYNCDAVVKIGFDQKQIIGEANTLRYYNGRGCVKLLDIDQETNSLLLDQIKPGSNLKSFFPNQENKSIEIAADVIQRLHIDRSDDNDKFPDIESWLNELNDITYIPSKYIVKAQTLANQLIKTQGKKVILHGDLHHENILLQEGNWIAIDPKGVVGELEYELGVFIRNPIPELLEENNVLEIISNRINMFGEILSLNNERIRDWSYVQAVLAACWSGKDSTLTSYMLKFADVIES